MSVYSNRVLRVIYRVYIAPPYLQLKINQESHNSGGYLLYSKAQISTSTSHNKKRYLFHPKLEEKIITGTQTHTLKEL